jgi:alcohol dehydrogenase (cytochrome c)
LRDQDDDPATTNDALYTDTTVALDPATGELVWYYQHMANDQWDYDWTFERQVLELEGADGGTEKLVVTMGKVGILDAVEADSGRYVFSIDMGIQNFITAIDPVTGAKTYDPDLIPRPGRQMVVCPHPGGGKSWLPGSYNSRTQVLFMPVVESCMDLTPVEGGRGFMGSGARVSVRPRPDTDGLYGRVQAIDLGTRETLWTARQRAPQSTGVLATAGGVVFAGALDRWLTAYDDRNGEILWRIRLNDVPNSAPITFMVDGRQYLAATVGNGGAHPQTFAPLVPEIPLPVARSSTLWVFEVGE